MCSTCGCDHDVFQINGEGHRGSAGDHQHHDQSDDGLGGHHSHGLRSAQEAGPGGERRILELEQDVLAKNKRYADENRRYLRGIGVLALNVVSSPGAGKTTLLARSIQDLKASMATTVIEGDQQTRIDAERLVTAGAQAIQINTGKGCHLDAHMVGHALEQLSLQARSLLFIENVGNLVCPAEFDLGETRRVVVLSVTEGDDKPLKYPPIFASADLILLTKTDLLPYVDFDVDRCLEHASQVNAALQALQVSAKTGAGLHRWYAWIQEQQRAVASQLNQ
jgi:hydrogenase nickel incorporation protein HypB